MREQYIHEAFEYMPADFIYCSYAYREALSAQQSMYIL